MSEGFGKARHYPIDKPGPDRPPDYSRVIRMLSDAELEDEILGRRGEAAYQLALLAEADRRAAQ